MTLNDIIVILLLIFAIGDMLGLKYLLPRMRLEDEPLPEDKRQFIIKLVHAWTLLLFCIAILLYAFKPLD